MTLAELEKSSCDFLDAEDVAPFIGCNPHYIRVQAQTEPDKLGFPVIVINRRVKIPREAFVFYCRYGRPVFVEGSIT